MRWIMGYCIAICLLLVIISQSIIFPTFFMPFFTWQYNRLGVAETVQMEKDELMRVTTDLLDYMRNRRDSLEDVYAIVAGQERRFFSDIEIRHMIDVLDLYNVAFMIRNIAFFVMVGLILCMILLKYRVLYVLARCCREVLTGFMILSAILVGLIAINFERAFDIFHVIFFNNDYWILDPRVDLLINMVPIYFFIHISIFIALLLVLSSAVIIVTATVYLRHTSQQMFDL
ncbi:MAG: TIGR01906 family membrane protein [Firmicutes bacterium]|nr:TIGR01906 family membrane protein [Bacillota bacterium]